MPPRETQPDLVALLLNEEATKDRALSGKSRRPSLLNPALLHLRSRYIFGVGARADIMAALVMREKTVGGERASTLRPTGYTKQTASIALEELAAAGVLRKFTRGASVRYKLIKGAPLRALLAPLPQSFPQWTERFAIVAHVLEAWRRFGSRATYALELAKIIDGLRPLSTALGERPPTTGHPSQVLDRLEGWTLRLLSEDIWEDAWMVNGEDILPLVVDKLSDDIVQVVHEGDLPVGHTQLDDFVFRLYDEKRGVADFQVRFAAEHPREDFDYTGRIEGRFRFAPDATSADELMGSIELQRAVAQFDIHE